MHAYLTNVRISISLSLLTKQISRKEAISIFSVIFTHVTTNDFVIRMKVPYLIIIFNVIVSQVHYTIIYYLQYGCQWQNKKQPFIWRLAQLILLIPHITNFKPLFNLKKHNSTLHIYTICTMHNNINNVSTNDITLIFTLTLNINDKHW